MICEKCQSDIETVVCARCGETITRLGPYCYLCGNAAQTEGQSEGAGPREEEEEVDFSSRVLCSDDACIGVINESGRCGVCGKPYSL